MRDFGRMIDELIYSVIVMIAGCIGACKRRSSWQVIPSS